MPTYGRYGIGSPAGRITEVGYANGNGSWEMDPGSAQAYEGTDDENSAPVGWGADPVSDLELSLMAPAPLNGNAGAGQMDPLSQELSELSGVTESQMIQAAEALNVAAAEASEPCGLTMAEWKAHQATMIADAEHAKRQKMIHLALAAGAGYFLCRFMR